MLHGCRSHGSQLPSMRSFSGSSGWFCFFKLVFSFDIRDFLADSCRRFFGGPQSSEPSVVIKEAQQGGRGQVQSPELVLAKPV